MSIFPPEERIWWNTPVEKSETLWVTIAFIWALVMFVMMPYWHISGNQNLSNEAYRISPEDYSAKVDAMVEQYTVGEDSDMPVVQPPPGSDVYLQASAFQWYPILKLEKGQSYRLHISSIDFQHGFSLQPININLQINPDYEMVMTVTPTTTGDQAIICNEFCGIGHHTMVGKINVFEK